MDLAEIGNLGGALDVADEPLIEEDESAIGPAKVDDLAQLRLNPDLQRHIQTISEHISTGRSSNQSDEEREQETQLLVQSNSFFEKISFEISCIHKQIVRLYSKKFADLDSILTNPVDYATIVQLIQNRTDTNFEFPKQFSGQIQMSIKMAASLHLNRELLSQEDLTEILKGCDSIIELDQKRSLIGQFVENRIQAQAPNLCALLGPRSAAQLVNAAGGLESLARTPACNILHIGTNKQITPGANQSRTVIHSGIVFLSPPVRKASEAYKLQTARALGGRVALCARIDYGGDDPNGQHGADFKDEIEEKIRKWEEPPPEQLEKPRPLPPPPSQRKRRGGKRKQKWKEKYGLTAIHQQQNKMAFGKEEQGYGEEERGLGMLVNADPGRMKVQSRATDHRLNKSANKRFGFDKKPGTK
ncbi:putative U4/U6 small nuclear ribonucleoprotein Prp31 [Blattamonas nauphoetae]|uniref:U4/U6 small nuclear ribonucleoprotein Prp31 n=1 Tax=Blattamonas nauphoetae TaxID=2049346 RepID=A0ABQ9XQT6_9EUKA|nr:putative U4/U6 small nuclear ribonucleoprotein Prp31 [Blattamonas nauphoetae]